MVNMVKHSRPKGRNDCLSVLLGKKEIPISSFQANFAFDAFSHNFSFTTPANISPFPPDVVSIYIGDILIFSGYIYSVKTNGYIFDVSGKSLTSVLERNTICPTGIGWTFKKISPLEVANTYGNELGIIFTSDSAEANRNIDIYEASDTATVSQVIIDMCQMNTLFVSAGPDNKAQLKHLKSLGNEIFTLDTEKPDIPFDNLSVEYDSAALCRKIVGVIESGENQLINTSERIYESVPLLSKKIIKPQKLQTLESVIDTEVIKSLILATKVTFSLPFVLFNQKTLKTYDTFHLKAKRYGVENRQFSITKLSYSISPDAVKTDITACLSSALFGALD